MLEHLDLQVGIRRHGRLNWQCHDPTHLAIRITEAILAYDILLPEEEHQIVSVECSEVQDWAFLKFLGDATWHSWELPESPRYHSGSCHKLHKQELLQALLSKKCGQFQRIFQRDQSLWKQQISLHYDCVNIQKLGGDWEHSQGPHAP